jgi:polyisoprenoid-binding protein YceI
MKYSILLVCLIALQYAVAQTSPKMNVDLSVQDSKVEFLAVGKPSMLKISGTGGKANGQIEIENKSVKGTIIVPLAEFTTGIALRDEHMKTKYLEIEKFPEATFLITAFEMEKNYLKVNGSQKDTPFRGKLKIHGVEKVVDGSADLNSDDETLFIIAKINTNISDHKIQLPSYLGVKLADKIAITMELKIRKR